MERLVEDGQPAEIPVIESCGYLIDYLFEVGPVMSGGMGECPLTHGELSAWQRNVGIELTPWEVRVLRKLSMDYLIQAQQSTKPDCLPPYGPAAHRMAVAKKIDEIFG